MPKEKQTQPITSTQKKKPLFFKFFVLLVRMFYRERTFKNTENLPTSASIIISNHAQMHGPITSELFFPAPKSIWCIGQMMKTKEVPAYAYKDFWSHKPKCTKWFYKLLSYIIAPLASFLMRNADTIAVYKDSRIISTFKNSVNSLKDGKHVIIFPESQDTFNEIVNDFQDKFVDVAKMYYDKTQNIVSFVPSYNCPALKTVVFGTPLMYNPELDIQEQRQKVCTYLKEEITRLAKELPQHKVVPYANIKKKNYPLSK